MEICPRKGVLKEKFPNTRKPSHWRVCQEFWNLRGQHNHLVGDLTAEPKLQYHQAHGQKLN